MKAFKLLIAIIFAIFIVATFSAEIEEPSFLQIQDRSSSNLKSFLKEDDTEDEDMDDDSDDMDDDDSDDMDDDSDDMDDDSDDMDEDEDDS